MDEKQLIQEINNIEYTIKTLIRTIDVLLEQKARRKETLRDIQQLQEHKEDELNKNSIDLYNNGYTMDDFHIVDEQRIVFINDKNEIEKNTLYETLLIEEKENQLVYKQSNQNQIKK